MFRLACFGKRLLKNIQTVITVFAEQKATIIVGLLSRIDNGQYISGFVEEFHIVNFPMTNLLLLSYR